MLQASENEPTPAVTIEFRFFGSFAIRAGDRWQPGPPPKKGGELIQYLGAYPKCVAGRDELAAAFWPGLDIEDVEHRIHLAASGARVYLRRVLDGIDALQCVSGGYAWHPSVRIASDAQRFIEHTRRATLDHLRAAIDMYGGDFLAGETADWLQPMRVRLASARACALEAVIADLLARRQYAAALSFGLELVDAERGHEIGTRYVMRCFAALGQRTRAIEQYHRLERYLAEQISVAPTEETRNLVTAIVSGRVA